MRILMFGWEFPPVISGGLGTACFGLTRGLVGRGMDITFVLPTLRGLSDASHVNLVGADDVKGFAGRNLTVVQVDSTLMPYIGDAEYARLLERSEPGGMLSVKGLSGRYGPGLMAEIERYALIAGILARENACDVIHAHDWLTFRAGIEAKRSSGKPLVVHVHALEFDRSGENINQEVFAIEKQGMEAADCVVAVSHYTRNMIIARYGIPAAKIKVVHNAVSQEKRLEQLRLQKSLTEKIVLFLGRITFQKGPEYFVEAARKVIERIPDVRFVMAGTGDMFPRMVELMARYRMGRHFHFTGFLQGEDVDRILAMSDLYVMTSVSEPFGITPLEAMVYDVPVIISRQSGVAELLAHALKIDFWDIDKLASGIIQVLTDEPFASAMRANNQEALKTLTWDIAAGKMISVYNELAPQA